jgi:hypothetical protein
VSTPPDDLDALCLRCDDRDAVLAALEAACREEDFVRAPPQRLRGYGHFLNGEEDPSLRRFLVASVQDWDHAWTPQLLAHLPVRAAYLMLHDGDVCTLHAYDGPELLAELVTSRAHFDLPPAPPDERLRSALEHLAGRPVSAQDVDACCFPPGAIDVDGRLAHDRIVDLLGLPAGVRGSYGLALQPDGRTAADSHAAWIHACWQHVDEARSDEQFERDMAAGAAEAEGEAPPPEGDAPGGGGPVEGTILPFRRPGES